MSLGTTLKSAREAKGLTASQIAAKTRILVQIIEGIEAEDFSGIAAPIYGRGFVKLYAEAVGLEAKPLQKEFMDILEGRQPRNAPPPPKIAMPPAPAKDESPIPAKYEAPVPAKHEVTEAAKGETPSCGEGLQPEADRPAPAKREAPEADRPAAATCEAAAPAQPPPALRGLALFDPAARPPEAPVQPVSSSQSAMPSRPANPFAPPPEESSSADGALERFHEALSCVSHGVLSNVQRLPRNTGRFAIAGVVAAVLLAFLVWGVILLYKATSPRPAEPSEKPAREAIAEATPVENEKAAPKTAKPDATASTKNAPSAAKSEPAAAKPAPAKSEPAAAKPAPAKSEPAAAKREAPRAPGKLHATGVDVPALYID